MLYIVHAGPCAARGGVLHGFLYSASISLSRGLVVRWMRGGFWGLVFLISGWCRIYVCGVGVMICACFRGSIGLGGR